MQGAENKLEIVTLLGNKQWELRENRFHLSALEEVNSLIRKYNNVAPYSVRKAYVELPPELERVYRDSQERIREELASKRLRALDLTQGNSKLSQETPSSNVASARLPEKLGILERFRKWITSLRQNTD